MTGVRFLELRPSLNPTVGFRQPTHEEEHGLTKNLSYAFARHCVHVCIILYNFSLCTKFMVLIYLSFVRIGWANVCEFG